MPRRCSNERGGILDELGMRGYPKTSGGRGLHIYVRIRPDWEFADVRRAAWGFASEVVSRAPDRATVSWWRSTCPATSSISMPFR